MKRKLPAKHAIASLLLSCVLYYNGYATPDVLSDTLTPGSAVEYIDPTIGNVGHLLEPTRPTCFLPNQVIRVYPIRKDGLDDRISSFPLTMVSHRLGNAFAIKPFIAPISSAEDWNVRMPYDYGMEVIRPWYYSVLLDEGVRVEFTPGRKTGIYRFTFPRGENNSILLNVYNGGEAAWHFLSGSEVTGMETWHDDTRIFMYGVFNVPGTAAVVANNEIQNGNDITGKRARACIHFPTGTRAVEFKYAISFVSVEQAKRNFEEEIRGPEFAAVEKNGKKIWSAVVSQIKVEGGTEAQRRAFYTALYRCQERMVNISEDSFYYSGFNNRVNKDTRPFYVDDWSWDTYLALHPLRTILHPRVEEDMLQSYVRMYEQSGWMPTFPVLFGDHPCMNGFHSSISFLDGYRKGLRDFDIGKAYEGMRKNAAEATMLPWRNGVKIGLDDFYQANGYFPALPPDVKETVEEVHPFEKRQAVAVTLGTSYDDWATGQMAKELGKTADFSLFDKWGMNYKNLWNKEQKFFLPKDDKGNWINIDPKFDGGPGGRDYYDENNGWTYLWQVQQDIPGLVDLMGGKKAFEDRLDQLFREDLGRSKFEFWNKFPDATALIGQHSMGNEPSFHIPYLYNFTDAPWKTQRKIRLLLSTWFTDNIFGIPGDEDGGGMSAFVVFSSMGFYPVTPGLPLYTIGSPVFSKVTIALENGKKFTVIARNSTVTNKYIQSARMNGKPLNTPWFSHEQLVNGGTLELVMGPKPDKKWGVERKYSDSSAFRSYKGLTMTGYQGWFNTPGDGAGRGWNHYAVNGKFEPGFCKVDLWPDISEYKKTYESPFRHADGSPARLFSSYDSLTVDLHFKWMKEYGIDGAFVQRAVSNIKDPVSLHHTDEVLCNVLAASKQYHRAIAIMYDFQGMNEENNDCQVVINDWKRLVDSLHIACRGNKQTYLYHNGKPLVAIWGVGFPDRTNSLKETEKIIAFLKNDPVYGGCSVLLGVPAYWRDFGKDTEKDPYLHELIRKADIIRPWLVARFNEDSYDAFKDRIKADISWCRENNLDYAPVVFPGFSWHNMHPASPINQIPRDRGKFFWQQLAGAIEEGAEMLYITMFDEIDEGTAIFKITNDPPVGQSSFLRFEAGIPSDYYLYLTGMAARMLRKEIPFQMDRPLP